MSIRNKIIVLEGLPGTGKTILGNRFSHEIIVIPEMILSVDDAKKEGELFYFKNDIAKIKKAKKNNGVILVERSYASTLAHNYARLVVDGDADYFNILEAFANNKKEGKLVPDLYIYLDIGIISSLSRKDRPVSQDDIWTQEKYLNVIHNYYKTYFQLMEPDIPVVIIDGERGLDAVYADIKKYIIS